MMRKPYLPSYSSGVLTVVEQKQVMTDFGARRNAKTLDDTNPLASLCYEVVSIRDSDQEFADREAFTLSLKVKCPAFNVVKPDHMVIIDRMLYAIKYMDKDPANIWLYLEEVREIKDDADAE